MHQQRSVSVRYSLRTRITVATVGLFVVGIVALSAYASRLLRDDIASLLGAQQFSMASMVASDLDGEISDRLKWLESVAVTITPAMIGRPVELQSFLAQRLILHKLFNGGGIIYDAAGTVVADSQPQSGRIGTNSMDVDTVAKALKEGKANIGKPAMDTKLIVPTFGMTVPIRGPDGRVVGAFAGMTNLGGSNFLDKIGVGRLGNSGGYILVDRQHRLIITASDRKRIMEVLPVRGVSQTMDRFIDGQEGTQVFLNPLGVEVLTAVKGIPSAGWYLAASLPTAEAFAPIDELERRILWATVFLTLLATGLIWWLLRRQLAAMMDTAQTLARIAESEKIPDALPVTRQDEVGELVTGFNRLLDRLTVRDKILQSILATSLDGFWRVDRDGQVIDVNDTYCRQSGYSREELLGMSISVLEANENQEEVAEHMRCLIEFGHDMFETRHRRKDGSLWDVEVNATYSENADGLLCVFLRDISARKRTEAEIHWINTDLDRRVKMRTAELEAANQKLVGAKDAAEAASRAKSTFLANMSHELRTPLNGILGMTELALRRAQDPKLKDHLDKALQASQHLLHVINDILDFSKIEAKRLPLEHVDFTLDQVLENLVSMLGQKMADKGLKFHIQLEPGLPARRFNGDPMRLGQVLLNLAGNALKFTERGAITVRANMVEDSPEGVLLRWEVVDTGIGIDADAQKRLFSAFEQADNSMTRRYGGSGLGLAISHQLAELMGGEIGVESTPGQGSTFWFTVRLGEGGRDFVSPVPPLPAESAEMRLQTRHAGTRVLLAEDEPINREVSRGLLEDVGLVVDLAENGQQALALAQQSPYAVILMDMQMPVLNGIDATRAIRIDTLNSKTPILAMTANAFDEDRQTCLDAGMNDHIAKPVVPQKLYESLLTWLEERSD